MNAMAESNPLAQAQTIAVLNTRRDVEYGIAFYRNQRVINYRNDGVPLDAHLLITHSGTLQDAQQMLDQRPIVFLMHNAAQDLDVYWVAPAKTL
jgi:hypothetical protein